MHFPLSQYKKQTKQSKVQHIQIVSVQDLESLWEITSAILNECTGLYATDALRAKYMCEEFLKDTVDTLAFRLNCTYIVFVD